MKFCENIGCENILTPNFKNNILTFYCETCYNVFEASNDDTLLSDNYRKEENSLYKHKTYLHNAHADKLTNLVKKKCINNKCNETILREVNVDKDQISLFICPKCKTQQFN